MFDWHSCLVLAWRRSHNLDGAFCQEMLEEALGRGSPEILNTDQGSQFTPQAWTRGEKYFVLHKDGRTHESLGYGTRRSMHEGGCAVASSPWPTATHQLLRRGRRQQARPEDLGEESPTQELG
jgi:hypothetical protein